MCPLCLIQDFMGYFLVGIFQRDQKSQLHVKGVSIKKRRGGGLLYAGHRRYGFHVCCAGMFSVQDCLISQPRQDEDVKIMYVTHFGSDFIIIMCVVTLDQTEDNFPCGTQLYLSCALQWTGNPLGKDRVYHILIRHKQFQGQHAFFDTGPVIWNSLPFSVCHAQTLSSFKSQLKTQLFSICFQAQKVQLC